MLVCTSTRVYEGRSSKNPCICMLIPSFYPLIGGAEQQAGQLARKLVDKGLKVFILTRRIKGTEKFEIINGVSVYRTFAKFHTIFFLLSSLLFLIRHKDNYDIIHVHTLDSPVFVACIIKKSLKKKVIVKIRGEKSLLNVLRGYLGKIKLKFIAYNIDYFVTVNKELECKLKVMGIGKDRIRMIPNGVDTNDLQPLRTGEKLALKDKLNLPHGKISTFVGRLIKGKKVDLIIEVWLKIIELMSESYLLIIGRGPEKEKLKNMIEKCHLYDRVILVGECPHSLVIKYLQASDVFILVSESEGVSNAMLEAMSIGLPVVAAKISGSENIIIDKNNGLLFEAGNKEQLQSKLVKILSEHDYREKLGKEARNTVESKFSFDVVIYKYTTLYKELVHG